MQALSHGISSLLSVSIVDRTTPGNAIIAFFALVFSNCFFILISSNMPTPPHLSHCCLALSTLPNLSRLPSSPLVVAASDLWQISERQSPSVHCLALFSSLATRTEWNTSVRKKPPRSLMISFSTATFSCLESVASAAVDDENHSYSPFLSESCVPSPVVVADYGLDPGRSLQPQNHGRQTVTSCPASPFCLLLVTGFTSRAHRPNVEMLSAPRRPSTMSLGARSPLTFFIEFVHKLGKTNDATPHAPASGRTGVTPFDPF